MAKMKYGVLLRHAQQDGGVKRKCNSNGDDKNHGNITIATPCDCAQGRVEGALRLCVHALGAKVWDYARSNGNRKNKDKDEVQVPPLPLRQAQGPVGMTVFG
jgi:hypothetical protein